jgi:hypothetical protein
VDGYIIRGEKRGLEAKSAAFLASGDPAPADVTLTGRPVQSRGPARAPPQPSAPHRGIKRPPPRPRLGARGHALAPPSGRWRGALRGRAPCPPPRSPLPDTQAAAGAGPSPSAAGWGERARAARRRRSPPPPGTRRAGWAACCNCARPLFSMRPFRRAGYGAAPRWLVVGHSAGRRRVRPRRAGGCCIRRRIRVLCPADPRVLSPSRLACRPVRPVRALILARVR